MRHVLLTSMTYLEAKYPFLLVTGLGSDRKLVRNLSKYEGSFVVWCRLVWQTTLRVPWLQTAQYGD